MRELVALALNRVPMTLGDQWGLKARSRIWWTRARAFISSKLAYQRHQAQWHEVSCMCKCVYMDIDHHVAPLAMIYDIDTACYYSHATESGVRINHKPKLDADIPDHQNLQSENI
jgi:hypothetical protein